MFWFGIKRSVPGYGLYIRPPKVSTALRDCPSPSYKKMSHNYTMQFVHFVFDFSTNSCVEGIVQRLKTYKDPELVHEVKVSRLLI